MLKRIILCMAMVCSSCHSDMGQYAYCSENSNYELYFDLKNSEIQIFDLDRRSLVALRILPCNKNPKYCFVGDIGLVNPFFAKISDYPNPVNISFNRNNITASVKINNKGNFIKYEIGSDGDLPEKFELLSKEGFASGKYSRCFALNLWIMMLRGHDGN